MNAQDWIETWEAEKIAFHRAEVHTDLIRWSKRFLDGGHHRVLVPLCGKTLDMDWLIQQGHEVVGIELSPIAAEAAFEESGREFSMRRRDGLNFYESADLTVICGDIFDVRREHVGNVDRVWDRAAIVALPRAIRDEYAKKIHELAAPGKMLLSAFGYDQTKMEGPPFSVPQAEVRRHYPELEVVEIEEQIDNIRPAWKEYGLESWLATTYLIDIGI